MSFEKRAIDGSALPVLQMGWNNERKKAVAIMVNNGLMSISDFGLEVSAGNIDGYEYIHKFGLAPDFDTGDNAVTVWDGADDGFIDQMNYVYSNSADIDSISSSNGGDTFQMQLQGLNNNFNLVTQNVTLQGQTRVPLTTPLRRIFRMKNNGFADNLGHIYCYVNTPIAGGVPIDSTQVRAIIQPGYNQTLMAVYTIPAGCTGYMRDWYAATAGASKDSNYIIQLRAREFDVAANAHKAFQLKHITSISDTGSSYIQHQYKEPEKFNEMVDIEMRVQMTAAGASEAAIAAGFDLVLVQN